MEGRTSRLIGALVILAVLIVVGLNLFGSPDEGEVVVNDPLDTSVITPSTVLAATTTSNQPFVYRVGLLAGVTANNFWHYFGGDPTFWNAAVLGQTKPALMRIDPQSQELVPELAATIGAPNQDENGWRIAINLKEGVLWSDGSPLTARDVEFTFETVRRLELKGGWADVFPESIVSVTAVGDLDLEIRFTEQPTLAMWPNAVGEAPIMPAHVWEEVVSSVNSSEELFAVTPTISVSGGPLVLESVSPDQITAFANPQFEGIVPDHVIYVIYESELAAVTGLLENMIDTILTPSGLAASEVERLDDSDSIEIVSSPANALRYLGFNLNREPMSSPAFRKALDVLIDRERLAADLVPGASPAYSIIPAANKASAALELGAPSSKTPEERIAEASSILAGAGYSWTLAPAVTNGELTPGTNLRINGVPPPVITILTAGSLHDPARPLYADEVEKALEVLGFDVRTIITDFDTVVDFAFGGQGTAPGQFDMYISGWTLGGPGIPAFYRPLFGTASAANSTGYNSEAFMSQLAAYESSVSRTVALAEILAMEKTLSQDLPYLPLYHPLLVEAYRADNVRFGLNSTLGGIQGRYGGLFDVRPATDE